ncbi:hypothetical protein BDV06DRAFT_224466 [Aspergillus oleicola]
MAPTIPLSVEIYENPGYQALEPVITPAVALDSNPDFIELHPLCEIDASNIEAVKTVAWDTPSRNRESNYSCQDYALDVLARLDWEFIVDATRDEYRSNLAGLRTMRDSWQ